MKEVRITNCCIFYSINDMVINRVTAHMPYILFQQKFKGVIAVERLFVAL